MTSVDFAPPSKRALRTADIYASGGVTRYHANPTMNYYRQTNADHQARAAKLLVQLVASVGQDLKADLLLAVLHHDVAERWMGDLPYTFKMANPEIAAAHANMERDKLSELGLGEFFHSLTEEDWKWLNLVDKLEALLFMAMHVPHLAKDRFYLNGVEYVLGLASGISPAVHTSVSLVLRALQERNNG